MMNKKIKLSYSLSGDENRSFIVMVPKDITCKEFLEKINLKYRKKYDYLFFKGSEIDHDDIIYDFWEDDHDYIFVVSDTPDPPKEYELNPLYHPRVFKDSEQTTRATTVSAKPSLLKPGDAIIDPITGQTETKIIEKQKSSAKTDKSEENYFIDEDEENKFHAIIGQIGEGSTSFTYKVIDKRNKTLMCKKVLKYKEGQTTIKDAKRAIQEFHILYNISHPCICKALGINISEKMELVNKKGEKQEITTIAIFLEYIEYGLNEVLKAEINNTLKVRIILDIVHAMNYLHKHGMIHRDLKIENIMLNEFFETKLVDFGLMKITESALDDFSCVEDSMTKGVGTLAYMSPEMMNEEDNYDSKTDVYSFGVVLHFIFTSKFPKQKMMDKMIGKPVELPSPSKLISPFCIKLISMCLEYSPSKRPSFKEILDLMRENSYGLVDGINYSLLKKRDSDLSLIE